VFPQLILLTLAAHQLFFQGQPIELTGTPQDQVTTNKTLRKPASLCIGIRSQSTCYHAPKDYWIGPKAEIVQIHKNAPAILFSAESYGVSGWNIHFALLRPDNNGKLENLLAPDFHISNQGQHRLTEATELSNHLMLLTAESHWGPEETKNSPHRYLISVYTLYDPAGPYYQLTDRYMTVRKYDPAGKDDILAAEAPEWKSRLRRVLESTR
jgi:hypothetical protein